MIEKPGKGNSSLSVSFLALLFSRNAQDRIDSLLKTVISSDTAHPLNPADANGLLLSQLPVDLPGGQDVKLPGGNIQDINSGRVRFRVETEHVAVRAADGLGSVGVGRGIPSPLPGNVKADDGETVLSPAL